MTLNLNVIIRKEESSGAQLWVAQVLEHDIATQADSIERVTENLLRIVKAFVEVAAERGEEPFARLQKAPRFYWNLWEKDGAVKAKSIPKRGVTPKVNRSPEVHVVPTVRFACAF